MPLITALILIPRWGMTFESLVLLTMAEVHLANNLRTAPDTYTPIKVPPPSRQRCPLSAYVQVMERSLHSARACFVENLAPVLTSGELAVLDSWYRLLDTNPDLDMEVDLVIYLQTSPEVSISRVQSRSRSEEQQVTIVVNIIPDPFRYFWPHPRSLPTSSTACTDCTRTGCCTTTPRPRSPRRRSHH